MTKINNAGFIQPPKTTSTTTQGTTGNNTNNTSLIDDNTQLDTVTISQTPGQDGNKIGGDNDSMAETKWRGLGSFFKKIAGAINSTVKFAANKASDFWDWLWNGNRNNKMDPDLEDTRSHVQ